MKHFSNWKVTDGEELKVKWGCQGQKYSWNPIVKN